MWGAGCLAILRCLPHMFRSSDCLYVQSIACRGIFASSVGTEMKCVHVVFVLKNARSNLKICIFVLDIVHVLKAAANFCLVGL